MSIRSIIRRRDGFSNDEINEMFEDVANRVAAGDDPENVLQEIFSLEPDYIFDAEFLSAILRAVGD